MKWRVVLAVLFVLLLFAGFADLYINAFVRKRQFAIILFVVNGLDLNTLNLARQQTGRSTELGDPDDPAIGAARRRAAYRSERLYLDSFWNVALLNVQEPGQPVPDEGADATAIACGRRVENGYVATNHAGATLTSLIYAAEKARRATGLVTTSALVEATPVAFYSSIRGRLDPDRNASDLIYSKIDVILGGGEQYFTPASAANLQGRADHEDLLKDAKDQGYTVLHTRDQLNHFYTWMTPRLLGLFADDDFTFASLQPESRRQPSLAEMTRVAVSGLNKNINGYFLVVEHGLVARAAGQNGGTLTANEVGEVDEAIQTAVAYAGPDALVLVTNNYSLGGSGPQAAPTAEPAWLASRGQGSAQLRGFINNTDVYDIVSENF